MHKINTTDKFLSPAPEGHYHVVFSPDYTNNGKPGSFLQEAEEYLRKHKYSFKQVTGVWNNVLEDAFIVRCGNAVRATLLAHHALNDFRQECVVIQAKDRGTLVHKDGTERPLGRMHLFSKDDPIVEYLEGYTQVDGIVMVYLRDKYLLELQERVKDD